MFFLWVIKRDIATRTEKILNTNEGVSNMRKRNTGNAIPALIEETETIPVISNIVRNTPKQHKVSMGCRASKAPNTVATPFPPLKPAKTGKI